jgi:hypothetical protein
VWGIGDFVVRVVVAHAVPINARVAEYIAVASSASKRRNESLIL